MPTPTVRARLLPALVAVAATVSCGGGDEPPPVATPAVTLARSEVAIGSPVEMRYRFTVAAGAPAFQEDYWVFVHFLDRDRELMWTDDHQPATPTRAWKPGATVEYTRTMFVPKVPYTGTTIVELGLFSPESGARLPLNADTSGQRGYTVATFDMVLDSEARFVVFREGWHATEVADDEVGTEWQWSKGEASLVFRNPRTDVTFYLQLDQPVNALPGPQQVELRLGAGTVDRFALPAGARELRMFPLTQAQLGDSETVEMRLAVDRTFVPAEVPALRSGDTRELGVRVFRAYIEPR